MGGWVGYPCLGFEFMHFFLPITFFFLVGFPLLEKVILAKVFSRPFPFLQQIEWQYISRTEVVKKSIVSSVFSPAV